MSRWVIFIYEAVLTSIKSISDFHPTSEQDELSIFKYSKHLFGGLRFLVNNLLICSRKLNGLSFKPLIKLWDDLPRTIMKFSSYTRISRAQFRHLARFLAKDPRNEVVYATSNPIGHLQANRPGEPWVWFEQAAFHGHTTLSALPENTEVFNCPCLPHIPFRLVLVDAGGHVLRMYCCCLRYRSCCRSGPGPGQRIARKFLLAAADSGSCWRGPG